MKILIILLLTLCVSGCLKEYTYISKEDHYISTMMVKTCPPGGRVSIVYKANSDGETLITNCSWNKTGLKKQKQDKYASF